MHFVDIINPEGKTLQLFKELSLGYRVSFEENCFCVGDSFTFFPDDLTDDFYVLFRDFSQSNCDLDLVDVLTYLRRNESRGIYELSYNLTLNNGKMDISNVFLGFPWTSLEMGVEASARIVEFISCLIRHYYDGSGEYSNGLIII